MHPLSIRHALTALHIATMASIATCTPVTLNNTVNEQQHVNTTELANVSRDGLRLLPRMFREGYIGINDCGASTFEDRTTIGAPLVEDCKMMADLIDPWKTHTLHGSDQKRLESWGTCAIGAEALRPQTGLTITYVGGGDLQDLVDESIQKFTHELENGKRMGARGEMKCEEPSIMHKGEQISPVLWGIYQV